MAGKGRAPHVPTAAIKRKVTMLLASGETTRDIAANIGLSQPALLKHYKDELREARLNRKAELLRRMERLSKGEKLPDGETAKYIFNATKFFLERYYNQEEKTINGGGDVHIRIDSHSGDL